MLYVGTSGWAYPSWKPAFYPEKLAQKKFLQFYSSKLNAVEVNYTFHHMVSEKTLQSWIADTPPDFRFCIKAHQAITHIRRLKNTEELLQRFLSSIEPLAAAGRLGSVLFQLPPNLKADPMLLHGFVTALPTVLRASFEFRNPSWFNEEVFAMLRKHNLAICVAESEERDTPDVPTAPFRYYRYRKPDYSAAERRAIAANVTRQCADADVFVFFKHEETPEGALYAEELLNNLRGKAA
jgi:uncharacterized protein YecE (DUF72 family)